MKRSIARSPFGLPRLSLARFARSSILALAATAGCASSTANKKLDLSAISSFKVTISSGPTGTEASPLPFTIGGTAYTIQATAIDGRGNVVTSFAGPVNVSAVPGRVTGATMTCAAGVCTGNPTLSRAFGPTHIWVEDPASYATGVTDTIWFKGPRIPDVQTSTTTANSTFNGERVAFDTDENLVVVAIARDGFYVSDPDVAGGAWGSIYAYTFGKPGDLAVGDKITKLSGTIQEFLGFTELNNPTWTPAGNASLPPPNVVTCTQLNAPSPNLQMEQLEASLIEVDGATVSVCSGFPNCPDYDQYRQWTVNLGGCAINVVSNYTLINFDPTQNTGKTIKLVGTLRNVGPASPPWILEPRATTDACCPSCTPALTSGC